MLLHVLPHDFQYQKASFRHWHNLNSGNAWSMFIDILHNLILMVEENGISFGIQVTKRKPGRTYYIPEFCCGFNNIILLFTWSCWALCSKWSEKFRSFFIRGAHGKFMQNDTLDSTFFSPPLMDHVLTESIYLE